MSEHSLYEGDEKVIFGNNISRINIVSSQLSDIIKCRAETLSTAVSSPGQEE